MCCQFSCAMYANLGNTNFVKTTISPNINILANMYLLILTDVIPDTKFRTKDAIGLLSSFIINNPRAAPRCAASALHPRPLYNLSSLLTFLSRFFINTQRQDKHHVAVAVSSCPTKCSVCLVQIVDYKQDLTATRPQVRKKAGIL